MGNGGLCYGNARIKPRILALEGGCEEGPAITIPTILRGPRQASSSCRFFSLKDLFSLFLKFTTPDSVIWVKKKCAFEKATKHWKQWLLCHLLYQQRFLWRLIKIWFWSGEHQCRHGLGMEGLNLDSEEEFWASVDFSFRRRAFQRGTPRTREGAAEPRKEDLEGLNTKGHLVSCLTTRLAELIREPSDWQLPLLNHEPWSSNPRVGQLMNASSSDRAF